MHFLGRIASAESCPYSEHSGSYCIAPIFPSGPTRALTKLSVSEMICKKSCAMNALPPPFILVLVPSKSNFLFLSCYFWKQLSDLKGCHAQEMCFGSSASCILWMIRSNWVAARWLISLLQNNRSHWRINNVFIVSPQRSVWNFLS